MTTLTFGMMWRIDKKEKGDYRAGIRAATAFYKNKYHQQPTHCVVNDKSDAPKSVDKVKVQRIKEVRPNHVFVGVIETVL